MPIPVFPVRVIIYSDTFCQQHRPRGRGFPADWDACQSVDRVDLPMNVGLSHIENGGWSRDVPWSPFPSSLTVGGMLGRSLSVSLKLSPISEAMLQIEGPRVRGLSYHMPTGTICQCARCTLSLSQLTTETDHQRQVPSSPRSRTP